MHRNITNNIQLNTNVYHNFFINSRLPTLQDNFVIWTAPMCFELPAWWNIYSLPSVWYFLPSLPKIVLGISLKFRAAHSWIFSPMLCCLVQKRAQLLPFFSLMAIWSWRGPSDSCPKFFFKCIQRAIWKVLKLEIWCFLGIQSVWMVWDLGPYGNESARMNHHPFSSFASFKWMMGEIDGQSEMFVDG